jgi:hypothetical protein
MKYEFMKFSPANLNVLHSLRDGIYKPLLVTTASVGFSFHPNPQVGAPRQKIRDTHTDIHFKRPFVYLFWFSSKEEEMILQGVTGPPAGVKSSSTSSIVLQNKKSVSLTNAEEPTSG